MYRGGGVGLPAPAIPGTESSPSAEEHSAVNSRRHVRGRELFVLGAGRSSMLHLLTPCVGEPIEILGRPFLASGVLGRASGAGVRLAFVQTR